MDESGSSGTIAGTISAQVSEMCWDSIPPEVAAYAKLLIADTVGVGLAGLSSGAAASARAAVGDMQRAADGEASVLGTAMRVSARDAALLNGITMDALGMDDTHIGAACHPSAVILPAALATAEATSSSGRTLLAAYVAGVEVQTRLGAAARMGFLDKGFGTTAVAGSFGAAVAAGKVLGLDRAGLTRAQGFVGGLTAGSMQFLGSGAWTKSVNKGWPAVCGITAAYFARSGFLAPSDIYEGRFGTFSNYVADDHEVDLARCTAGLGTDWEIMRVYSKRYPVCHFLDSALKAVANIMRQHDVDPGRIDRIVCSVPGGTVATICEPADLLRHPTSAYAASSSVYFNVALALHRGTVTISQQERHVNDPLILQTADKVFYDLLESTDFPDAFESEIRLSMSDGTEYRARESSNALSETDFEEKFFEQTEEFLGKERSREAWDTLLNLEQLTDLRALGRVLQPRS